MRNSGSLVGSAVMQALLYTMLGNLIDSSFSPLSTFLSVHYSLTSEQLGLITSSVFIGSLVVYSISGIVVDRFGNKFSMRMSFLLLALGAFICAFAPNFPILLIGFFSIGFGYGSITPATNSIIMESYYPKHAGPMGIKQAGVPVGSIVSVALLPFVARMFGLNWAFTLLAIAAVLVVLLTRGGHVHRMAVSLRSYFSEMLSAAKDRSLLVLSIFGTVLSMGQQVGLTFYVVYYESRGFSTQYAEISLLFLLVGAIIGRIFWSRIGNALFKGSRLYQLSLIMCISGSIFLLSTLVPADIYLVSLFSMLLGMNALGWNSTYVNATSEFAPSNKVGLYSGVSMVILALGTIIGAPAEGFIRDSTGSYTMMWVALSLVQITAAFLMAVTVRFLISGKKPEEIG